MKQHFIAHISIMVLILAQWQGIAQAGDVCLLRPMSFREAADSSATSGSDRKAGPSAKLDKDSSRTLYQRLTKTVRGLQGTLRADQVPAIWHVRTELVANQDREGVRIGIVEKALGPKFVKQAKLAPRDLANIARIISDFNPPPAQSPIRSMREGEPASLPVIGMPPLLPPSGGRPGGQRAPPQQMLQNPIKRWAIHSVFPAIQELINSNATNFAPLINARNSLPADQRESWSSAVSDAQVFAAQRLAQGIPAVEVARDVCQFLNERWFISRHILLHGDAGRDVSTCLYISDLMDHETHFLANLTVPLYHVRGTYSIAGRGEGVNPAIAHSNHIIVVDLDQCEREVGAGWSMNMEMSRRAITPQTSVQQRVLIKLAGKICSRYDLSAYVSIFMPHMIREELFHAVDSIRLERDIGPEAYWNWTSDSRRRFGETQLSANGILRSTFADTMNTIAHAPQVPGDREAFSNFFKDAVNEISAQLGRAVTDPDIIFSLAHWSLGFPDAPRTPHITAAIVITYLLARELGVTISVPVTNLLLNGNNRAAAEMMETIMEMDPERIRQAVRAVYGREFTHPLPDMMVLDSIIRANPALSNI